MNAAPQLMVSSLQQPVVSGSESEGEGSTTTTASSAASLTATTETKREESTGTPSTSTCPSSSGPTPMVVDSNPSQQLPVMVVSSPQTLHLQQQLQPAQQQQPQEYPAHLMTAPTTMSCTSCSRTGLHKTKPQQIKRKVEHDYHDHAMDPITDMTPSIPPVITIPQPVQQQQQHQLQQNTTTATTTVQQSQSQQQPTKQPRRGPRGGVAVPFPDKLHQMLSKVENDGYGQIVSWQPHGRSFCVHKPKDFVATVMPIYFRQTKLTSFQRQLNLYGFCRLTSGKDRGGYYHELFLRGRPHLCKRMMRTRIKGTGIKAASNPQNEPDFYSMPFVEGNDTVPELEGPAGTSTGAKPQPTPVASGPIVNVAPVVQPQPQQQKVFVTTAVNGKKTTTLPMATSLDPSKACAELAAALASAQQQHQKIIVVAAPSAASDCKADGSNASGNMITPPHTPSTIAIIAPSTLPMFPSLTAPAPAPVAVPPPPLCTIKEPAQDDLIMFEGQHFHYLDPSTFEQQHYVTTATPAAVFTATPQAFSEQKPVATTTQLPPPPQQQPQQVAQAVMVTSSSESSLEQQAAVSSATTAAV